MPQKSTMQSSSCFSEFGCGPWIQSYALQLLKILFGEAALEDACFDPLLSDSARAKRLSHSCEAGLPGPCEVASGLLRPKV